MIELTDNEIDPSTLLNAIADDNCGAQVLFLGRTRRCTGEQITEQLNYSAYHEMALQVLQELRLQAMRRWDIRHVAIVHRVGTVAVGQTSVAVAVASPHRAAAFESAAWLLEILKQEVPIWKQEVHPSGEAFWVHPSQAVQ